MAPGAFKGGTTQTGTAEGECRQRPVVSKKGRKKAYIVPGPSYERAFVGCWEKKGCLWREGKRKDGVYICA